ncbi:MAG: cell division ATP-binding protein FtsE [Myxococcales bacterium]|nr:MAG: cell division ATP-binding protein FtsE [Myxococcales bacterium]
MIQLFHVSMAYQPDQPVLVDANLQVEKGEFVYLTGQSGAGKTTILKLLFCEVQPTGGQVLVMGRNVSRISPRSIPYLRRKIGVVFQDFRLLPRRTVAENVAIGLEILGLSRREIDRRVALVLKQVGLAHRARGFPPQLSGGEQQRVAVARALIAEPAILLADEPTGNLDEDTTRDIMRLFGDANARGTTVLLATHDRRLFERTGRRVVRVEAGKTVFDSDIRLEAREAERQAAASSVGRRRGGEPV